VTAAQNSTVMSRLANLPVLLQMLANSFMWATSFLLMKLIGSAIDPLALTGVRGVMAGLLLAAGLALSGHNILPRGREWRDWSVLGVSQGIIPNTLTAYALTQIPAGLASMVQATSPLLIAIAAQALFADERLTHWRIVGLLVGFTGMALLLGASAFSGSPANLSGTMAMIATAVSYAVGSLYVRSIPHAQPERLALGQQAFAGFPVLALVLWFKGLQPFAAIPNHLFELAALGTFATAVPIVIYMNILRRAGPTLGSMTGYITPMWTVSMGILIFGEMLSARQAMGGALIISGLLIVSWSRLSRKQAP
jgi:drug/metabolite transporter (DMT)-like permease